MANTHHYPVLPVGIMRVDAPFAAVNSLGVQTSPFARFSWHFSSITAFPTGWLPIGAPTQVLGWLQSVTNGISPSGLEYPESKIFLNCPAGYFFTTTFFVPTGGFQGDFVSFDWCACFTKYGVTPGPSNRGRTHMYPVPKSFRQPGGLYTNAAVTAYSLCADRMKDNILINGVLWAPCIYSPMVGSAVLLDHVELVKKPTILYRRRQTRDKFAPAWHFVP